MILFQLRRSKIPAVGASTEGREPLHWEREQDTSGAISSGVPVSPSCTRMVLLFLPSQGLFLQIWFPVGAVSQWTAVSRVNVADFSIWIVASLVPFSVFPSLLGDRDRQKDVENTWDAPGAVEERCCS